MRRDPPEQPSGKAPASRKERLAQALRANLKRRKSQRRARNEADGQNEAARQRNGERQ
jgi:hypothetical protein